MVCSLIPTTPSLVGHVLVSRSPPLLNLHLHPALCSLNKWRAAALSGVSYSRNTLLPPLPTKRGLGRNAQSQKAKHKSSRSLSAPRQLNSREQDIPCSVSDGIWLPVQDLSTWFQQNTLILLTSLSLWIKLLTLIQSCQDWAKWVRTRIFYLLHEEHK